MVTKSKKAIYIGRIGLPNDAASIRVYNNSRILRHLGYSVDVLCLKEEQKEITSEVDCDSNIKYIFTKKNNKSSYPRLAALSNVVELIIAFKTYRLIKKYILDNKPDIVILYNDLFALSIYLRNLCSLLRIKLIADVTEWYEKRTVKSKISDYFVPFLTDKRIRFVDKRIKNIIAISPYLRDFYLKKSCNVLMLPPVFNLKEALPVCAHDSNTINFLYAGSPGSKDILIPFINALSKINNSGIKVRLDLLGVEDSYIKQLGLSLNQLATIGVFNHGRVPHDKVLKYLSNADFSLILRHNQRYAKAGFSTKLAESMSSGVAIFANSVGGAESLIENKINGILIKDTSEECIIDGLAYVLSLNRNDLYQLRQNAQTKALSLFSLDNYTRAFELFLSKC